MRRGRSSVWGSPRGLVFCPILTVSRGGPACAARTVVHVAKRTRIGEIKTCSCA